MTGSENLGWELLSSRELVKTPYFRLRSDRMRLPDGTIKDPYYVLERPDAAITLAITPAGGAVLVRQYRPPLRQEELGLPAGLVEAGESPEWAARRELLEETGYGGGQWEPLGAVASSPSLKDNWAYLYLARGVEPVGEQEPDEFERILVETAPVGELSDMISGGEIVNSSGVAAIMLGLEKMRGGS
ncbi:NUDIX hydrolase [soil metagenome]